MALIFDRHVCSRPTTFEYFNALMGSSECCAVNEQIFVSAQHKQILRYRIAVSSQFASTA